MGTQVTVIDLCNDEEFATGYIDDAVHIPIQQLLSDMTTLPAKDAPIVLVCQSGHRGGIGLEVLSMLGWTNVRNLAGGMNARTAAELPVVK